MSPSATDVAQQGPRRVVSFADSHKPKPPQVRTNMTPVSSAGRNTATPATPSTIKVNQTENINGPDHKYQINEELLYEQEFHGQTYASGHLQRLQHGIFATQHHHAKAPLHVTFVAVTFTFHPAVSIAHRFQSAIIEITAKSENQGQLRFVKFAPHLAYGRISSESLKWNFQLGATLGVTKGPVNLSVNPSGSYEKDKVIGTMMKIQGSTRSYHNHDHLILNKRVPDSKMVWTLEENDQQHSGLPREFTFIFLLARPATVKSGKKAIAMNGTEKHEKATHPATIESPHTVSKHRHEDADAHAMVDHADIFSPFTLAIQIKPRISGTVDGVIFDFLPQETLLGEEVGQTLPIESHSIMSRMPSWHSNASPKSAVEQGYYNFAEMPGNFEDLIEMPGNTVTSVEPSLPAP